MQPKTAASLIVLLATIVVVSMVAVPGAATHNDDSVAFYEPNETGGVNETDYPDRADGHYPGEEASWNRLIAVYSVSEGLYDNPNNHEHPVHLNWSKTYSPFINRCEVQNLEKFHMDHGDNNSGTDTSGSEDHNLLPATDTSGPPADFMTMSEFENKWGHTLTSNPEYDTVTRAYTNFWSEEEAQGDPTKETLDFGNADQYVVAWNDCYTNPDKPGWYRWAGVSSTTIKENKTDVKSFRVAHWTYICKCESEQQAREKLGPPPSVIVDSDDEETSTPEDEGNTPTQTDSNGGATTETDSGGATTRTEADNGGATTQTEADNGGATTQTEADNGGATTQTEADNGGETAGDGSGGTGGTPVEDQSGFGLVAGLLAVLLGALLARRVY